MQPAYFAVLQCSVDTQASGNSSLWQPLPPRYICFPSPSVPNLSKSCLPRVFFQKPSPLGYLPLMYFALTSSSNCPDSGTIVAR